MELYEGEYRHFGKLYDIGFKMMVHSPYEMPDDKLQYFTMYLNQSFLIYIKPQMETIDESKDESLVNMTPDRLVLNPYCTF